MNRAQLIAADLQPPLSAVEALVAVGELGQALAALLAQTSVASAPADSLRVQANLAREMDQYDFALEALRRLSAELPKRNDIRWQLLECNITLGDTEAAWRVLSEFSSEFLKTPRGRLMQQEAHDSVMGRALDPEFAATLVAAQPENEFLASRYLHALIQSDRLLDARRVARINGRRFPEKALSYKNREARILLMGGCFEQLEQLLTAAVDQNDPFAISLYIRSRLRQRDTDAATQMLAERQNTLTRAEHLELQAEVAEASRNFEVAIDSRRALLDIQPKLAHVKSLALNLLSVNDPQAVVRLLDQLASDYPASRPRYETQARLAYELRQFGFALECLQKLPALLPSRTSLGIMADCFWQLGRSRDAWLATTARSLNRNELLSTSTAVQRKAIVRLHNEVDMFQRRASKGSDEARAVATQLARISSNVPKLKSNFLINHNIGRILSKASRHEAAGRHKQFAECIESNMDYIVQHTSDNRRLADLALRVADAHQALELPERALVALQQACSFSADAEALLGVHLQTAQRTSIAAEFKKASSGTAVLVLSCHPQIARAEALAKHIHRETDVDVIVLSGDSQLSDPVLARVGYGFRLIVPADDGYAGLYQKLLQAYRLVFACSDYSGLLKLDDDVAIIDPALFTDMLRGFETNGADYVGKYRANTSSVFHHAPQKSDHRNRQYSDHHYAGAYGDGGFGYFLSRRALDAIYRAGMTSFQHTNIPVPYEDVMFGNILHDAGIALHDTNLPMTGGYLTDGYDALKLRRALRQQMRRHAPLHWLVGPLFERLHGNPSAAWLLAIAGRVRGALANRAGHMLGKGHDHTKSAMTRSHFPRNCPSERAGEIGLHSGGAVGRNQQ